MSNNTKGIVVLWIGLIVILSTVYYAEQVVGASISTFGPVLFVGIPLLTVVVLYLMLKSDE